MHFNIDRLKKSFNNFWEYLEVVNEEMYCENGHKLFKNPYVKIEKPVYCAVCHTSFDIVEFMKLYVINNEHYNDIFNQFCDDYQAKYDHIFYPEETEEKSNDNTKDESYFDTENPFNNAGYTTDTDLEQASLQTLCVEKKSPNLYNESDNDIQALSEIQSTSSQNEANNKKPKLDSPEKEDLEKKVDVDLVKDNKEKIGEERFRINNYAFPLVHNFERQRFVSVYIVGDSFSDVKSAMDIVKSKSKQASKIKGMLILEKDLAEFIVFRLEAPKFAEEIRLVEDFKKVALSVEKLSLVYDASLTKIHDLRLKARELLFGDYLIHYSDKVYNHNIAFK